MKLTHEKI